MADENHSPTYESDDEQKVNAGKQPELVSKDATANELSELAEVGEPTPGLLVKLAAKRKKLAAKTTPDEPAKQRGKATPPAACAVPGESCLALVPSGEQAEVFGRCGVMSSIGLRASKIPAVCPVV